MVGATSTGMPRRCSDREIVTVSRGPAPNMSTGFFTLT